MFLLTVIPISRGIGKQHLSYYYSSEVPAGALVKIPLRSSEKTALVVDCRPVVEAKSDIRRAPHQFKKVSRVLARQYFESPTISAIREAADWFLTTPGALLHHFSSADVLSDPRRPPAGGAPVDQTGVFERFLLQGDYSDRVEHYRQLIRENFSQHRSVLVLTPNQSTAVNLAAEAGKGVAAYTFCLHSGLTSKQALEQWRAALTEPHPVVIVMTPGFLTIPRPDAGLLILEQEGSRAYHHLDRPPVNIQTVAEFLAKHKRLRLLAADLILRSETVHRYQAGDFIELSRLSFRTPPLPTIEVLDMKAETKIEPQTKKHRGSNEEAILFSRPVRQLIEATSRQAGRLLLLTGRKGLAPTIVCQDCGRSLQCQHCSSSLTLYTRSKGRPTEQRTLACSACGRQQTAFDQCPTCHGWRLTSLGIGSERVAAALTAGYPELKVFRVDSQTASTYHQATKQVAAFLRSHSSVLVGTEMVLNYLPPEERLPEVVIISLDTLLTRPDYAMDEQIFRLLVRIRTACDRLRLQTRMPDHPLVGHLSTVNTRLFYQADLKFRQQFNYPPFSVLIKISIPEHPGRAETVADEWASKLAAYSPTVYPALTEIKKGRKIMNLLIKLPADNWPDSELQRLLSKLPQKYLASVNPINIL